MHGISEANERPAQNLGLVFLLRIRACAIPFRQALKKREYWQLVTKEAVNSDETFIVTSVNGWMRKKCGLMLIGDYHFWAFIGICKPLHMPSCFGNGSDFLRTHRIWTGRTFDVAHPIPNSECWPNTVHDRSGVGRYLSRRRKRNHQNSDWPVPKAFNELRTNW